MKKASFVLLLIFQSISARAAGLPVITTQPQNVIVAPAGTITQAVVATGATSYQWLCNGVIVPGATTSSLVISNAQATNAGYYMAIARNASGWTPSQMSYVSVVAQPGYVPLCNLDAGYATVFYQVGPGNLSNQPITNGYARAVAGPTLDQMQPIGNPTDMLNDGFDDGCYCDSDQPVPTVGPGQTVFYRVDFTYPYGSGTYTQPSRVLKLTAGGGTNPTPSTIALQYPRYIEWPTPGLEFQTPTNQVHSIGETFSFTNIWVGYKDYGTPTYQWRKNGTNIYTGSYFTNDSPYMLETKCTLTITNAIPSDAGIYDVVVMGDFWFIGPKITLSIQTTNAQATLVNPRSNGSDFLCDLSGVPGLDYAIDISTNLQNWNSLQTFSSIAGTVTFTNSMSSSFGASAFYRARLLQ